MHLVRALKSNAESPSQACGAALHVRPWLRLPEAQYPILRKDTGRYTPLMLHLASAPHTGHQTEQSSCLRGTGWQHDRAPDASYAACERSLRQQIPFHIRGAARS